MNSAYQAVTSPSSILASKAISHITIYHLDGIAKKKDDQSADETLSLPWRGVRGLVYW